MIAPGRLLVVPMLLAAIATSIALRQPNENAGAYSDPGGAVYPARILTPAAHLVAAQPPRVAGVTTATLPGLGNVPRSAGPAARLALAPAGSFDLRGAPSVSAATMESVLAAYASPLAGHAQALIDLGVKYGLDPAYCLAFFVHESAAGTRGEAVITHSVGNIRAVAGAPSRDGYKYYGTWLEGAEDWYRLIAGLYVRDWKLTTVDRIIPVYAPSNDNNDTQAYTNDVQNLVTAWRAQG